MPADVMVPTLGLLELMLDVKGHQLYLQEGTWCWKAHGLGCSDD